MIDAISYYPGDTVSRSELAELMTPQHILESTDFPQPEIIDPNSQRTFEELLKVRNEISQLRLVPRKTEEQRAFYHTHKENALAIVRQQLDTASFLLRPNTFRDHLPADVHQHIIWMKNPETKMPTVVDFLADAMEINGISSDEIIVFERPRKASMPFVRGTVSTFRHMHVWVKDANLTFRY